MHYRVRQECLTMLRKAVSHMPLFHKKCQSLFDLIDSSIVVPAALSVERISPGYEISNSDYILASQPEYERGSLHLRRHSPSFIKKMYSVATGGFRLNEMKGRAILAIMLDFNVGYRRN